MDAIYPEERGAWMRVTLRDGRTFERGIPVAKGEPENPVSDGDLLEKLSLMLAPYAPEAFVNDLWNICVESDIDSATYGDILGCFAAHAAKGGFCTR